MSYLFLTIPGVYRYVLYLYFHPPWKLLPNLFGTGALLDAGQSEALSPPNADDSRKRKRTVLK